MRRLGVDDAVAALVEGGVVAVPTDTVYGVAARVSDAVAVAQLFVVKRRPHHVALPVLVNSLAQVSELGVEWTTSAGDLATRFWPGALTIVVTAPPEVAALVGARSSLGLRVPRHDALLSIIAACGPLAVTSANEHGHPACTTADEVAATNWAAPVAGVVDGGSCDAPASSVVELVRDGWRLRRAGAIERADLESVLGPESRGGDH